jgi:hypothetical protein
MNEIDHFKKFVLCSDDVTANVDQIKSCFVHLVVYNTMRKMEFKMDIV